MDRRILFVPEFLFDEPFGSQGHGELGGCDQAHTSPDNGVGELQFEQLAAVQIGLGKILCDIADSQSAQAT